MNSQFATIDLLLSPTFHKFPGLKVALSEGGIGWMPYILERIDYTWERHRYYTGCNPDVRPSELFRDHIFGCFISDDAGLDMRHLIGVDNIMFESDYPHSDSNWPRLAQEARRVLRRARRRGPQDRRGQRPPGLQLPSSLTKICDAGGEDRAVTGAGRGSVAALPNNS